MREEVSHGFLNVLVLWAFCYETRKNSARGVHRVQSLKREATALFAQKLR
jgi:hypothetical protein